MEFIIYFFKKIILSVVSAIKHWYIDSFYFTYNWLNRTIKRLDRKWALKITFQHFFHPLYQDYTWQGYILGIWLRSTRILLASITYLFIFAFFLAAYLAWCFIPIAIFKNIKL